MGTDRGGMRWRVPALFAIFIAALVALITRRYVHGGNFPPSVPVAGVVLTLVLSLVIGWFGWSVRRYLRGKKAGLNPIRAARTLALAQAGALTGAALLGLYVGQAIGLQPEADLQAAQRILRSLVLGVLASGALLAAGLVAQHWCRIPPRTGGPGEDAPPDGHTD